MVYDGGPMRYRNPALSSDVAPLIRDIYRRLRESMGIKQGYLASKIGVSGGRLSKWEQEKAELSEKQIALLGKALETAAQKHITKYAGGALRVPSAGLLKELREA